MIEILLKLFLVFMFVYLVWLYTGGPERGAERAAEQNSSLFIGVDDEQRNTIFIGN